MIPLVPRCHTNGGFVTSLLSLFALSGLILLSITIQARADYLPLSGAEVAKNIAEVRVENDGLYVQLEIFIGDAQKFEALIPDSWFSADVSSRPSEAERLIDFGERGLTVRRGNGTALPVRLDRIEPRTRIDRTTALTGQMDPITGRTFPKPPDDPRVIFAELFYDFEGVPPDTIEIAPPTNPDGVPQVTIGFITFDRGLPVANFAYLSGTAELTIDWNDPWYSSFDSPNLKRHHQSGVTTFLYVEPRELRHETLIRVRDIDPWLGLELFPGRELSPQEQAKIKTDAASFLATRNPVSIDGRVAAPANYRAELLTIDPTGLQLVDSEKNLSADEAFIGVILSFPWRDLPESVSVSWDMFNDAIRNVPATSTDPAGPFLSGASPDDPEIVWRNHLLTYQSPTVETVPAMGAGRFSIPILSAISFSAAFAAIILALLYQGRARVITSAVAIGGIAGAILTLNLASIEMRNPFAQIPEAVDAADAFTALLENIHIANLETTIEGRQTALKPLVHLPAHSDVAAEVERAFALRVPGGGIARVTEVSDVRLQDLAPVDDGFGFRALAEWTARAKAGHWGHTHRRIVEYRALIEVIDEEGSWKLDGITVIETRLPDA